MALALGSRWRGGTGRVGAGRLESGPIRAGCGVQRPAGVCVLQAEGPQGLNVKFVLIDRIVALESGRRIVAEKALSLAEEYLADHFPRFPVLPGVLMLEAMVQAAAWVVRERLNFGPSLVLLKEARNVTYKSFVAPGQVLTVEAECQELREQESTFTARGHLGGREIVKGRLVLRHLRLAEYDAAAVEIDERLRAEQRARFALLWKGGFAGGDRAASGAGAVPAAEAAPVR